MNNPLFSIVIPTYNSQKTLAQTLESIKKQTVDKNVIEVLIIDGGSTDCTLEIAQRYDFIKVIHNPKRLPEYSKMLGINSSNGKFLIKMDSDEEFVSETALEDRLKAFELFSNVHLLVADKLFTPKKLNKSYVASLYSTSIGDPFTFFMYRPKDGIIKTYSNDITEKQNSVYKFSFKQKRRPIADGGTTTINLDYVKNNKLIDFNSVADVSSMSDKIMDFSPECICIKGDNIIHNNYVTFKRFIEKIKFRIINNVMGTKDSGFSNRRISTSKKQFLFPLYTISLVFPAWDAVNLSFRYKSLSFLLHPIYCMITTYYIAKFIIFRFLGKNIKNFKY